MSFSASELHLLAENLKLVRFFNYVSVALLTVMVYDTLLTMPREVRFIWKGEISLRKILYIMARYYALASLIVIVKMSLSINSSLESCRAYIMWFTSSTLPIEEAIINVLLILRINALYGGDKRVMGFILGMYLNEVVLLIYAGVRAAQIAPLSKLPAGISVPGCFVYVVTTPSFTFTLIGWVPALIFSATLLAFSAYKVRDDIALETALFWEFASWNRYHPLLLAIFRQGVIFFMVNTAITIINTVLLIRIHNVLDSMAVPMGIVAYSFCGCRFLLNFYELSTRNHPTDFGQTDGHIVFGDHGNNTFLLRPM